MKTMRRILALVLAALMLLSMAACASSTTATLEATETTASTETTETTETADTPATGVEDGVLTVGMECAYAPYNWTQMDDSDGAVPISNVPGAYANGYDVMIAKKICEANGWELEIVSSAWDSLCLVFRVGLSGVRNGFPESLGCCVKRRKAIGRHRQVEERDTAGIGILGRRRIGLDLVVRKRAGQVYEQGQILTFCERRIEPVAVQRTLAAPIEVTDSSGRERTGITPIEYADRLVGLACQRDNHVAVRSAVSIGIAAGSVLRPLVVKIVAVYDIVVGNQIIRVSTDLCCGRLANPAPVWSPRLPMMTLIPFAWSGAMYLAGFARIAALFGLL